MQKKQKKHALIILILANVAKLFLLKIITPHSKY